MLNRHKNWLVHKQTACGKDFSNPFMVDNLPKIVGFSTHLASLVKSWLVQDQTVLALASPKANDIWLQRSIQQGTHSNTDGLVAIVSKLDNLGCDMKKLKENVHAFQVGCQICKGPHLDKECSLNEEVKQVEEVKYGEFVRPAPFNRSNGAKFRGAQNEEERTTKVLQCQLPTKELNPRNITLPCTIGNFNFYGMADLDASVDVMPRNIFEYLRPANLRNTNMLVEMADMTKKATLGRPFFATIHTEINVFDKEISLGINKDRVSHDMEKKDHNFTTPTKKIFMIKSDLDNRPQSPACSNNQSRNLRDMSPDDSLHDKGSKKKKIKLDQHTPRAHFCEPIKQIVNEKTKMWPTCDPTKSMCDGGDKIYRVSRVGNLTFWYCNYDNGIKKITGIGLSFPGYLLAKYRKYQTDSLVWDDIYAEWCNEYYKDVHRDSTYWWHDHGFEEEECDEMGIKIEYYDPPNVQVETFKVKKYSFKSRQNFVCVTKEVDDALPLGRRNGSRQRNDLERV
ncbi:hypothetical protein Tco_0937737 [Tanacetum coccineum]|uniref:Uncharacterized protein n=1 Tax=Tanacetum coccineum TaxID=301880 RepID=A0ABQ5DFV3_9ASTR